MTPWTAEQRDDYLAGQVHALTAMVQALLRAHPEPQAVQALFEQELRATEAKTLWLPLTDAHQAGMHAVQAQFYFPGTNPAER